MSRELRPILRADSIWDKYTYPSDEELAIINAFLNDNESFKERRIYTWGPDIEYSEIKPEK